ncbi:MAG: hypothetical protein JWP11_3663 [Frankiales bacterium]|nr:hypothetical protein [Frankiales bacterium]
MLGHQWVTLVVGGRDRDGQPATAEVRAVLRERDGQPHSAWVPWWPTWARGQGALPISLS